MAFNCNLLPCFKKNENDQIERPTMSKLFELNLDNHYLMHVIQKVSEKRVILSCVYFEQTNKKKGLNKRFNEVFL